MNIAWALIILGVFLSALVAVFVDVWDECKRLEHEARLDELWGEE